MQTYQSTYLSSSGIATRTPPKNHMSPPLDDEKDHVRIYPHTCTQKRSIFLFFFLPCTTYSLSAVRPANRKQRKPCSPDLSFRLVPGFVRLTCLHCRIRAPPTSASESRAQYIRRLYIKSADEDMWRLMLGIIEAARAAVK